MDFLGEISCYKTSGSFIAPAAGDYMFMAVGGGAPASPSGGQVGSGGAGGVAIGVLTLNIGDIVNYNVGGPGGVTSVTVSDGSSLVANPGSGITGGIGTVTGTKFKLTQVFEGEDGIFWDGQNIGMYRGGIPAYSSFLHGVTCLGAGGILLSAYYPNGRPGEPSGRVASGSEESGCVLIVY